MVNTVLPSVSENTTLLSSCSAAVTFLQRRTNDTAPIASAFLTMIFSLISSVLSWFSFSRKKTDKAGYRSEERVQYSQNVEENKKNKKKKRGKFFDKNEGEYVDFEELK